MPQVTLTQPLVQCILSMQVTRQGNIVVESMRVGMEAELEPIPEKH